MLAQELPVWFCGFVWFKTEVSLAPGWQAKMVQGYKQVKGVTEPRLPDEHFATLREAFEVLWSTNTSSFQTKCASQDPQGLWHATLTAANAAATGGNASCKAIDEENLHCRVLHATGRGII